ncbi:MAG: GvpL/GvpF family gas vesicle protein [Acidothermales bacterium]|nr:GvpL/GvpF family gas vesicle protein [Acidothermales bacterium]
MSAGTGVAERADVGDVPDTLYYLYGVTHAGTKLPDVDGVGAMRPRLVESDGLALLAGDVPPGITVATRENLLAHGHLLDAVAQRSTVLPMRFGMLVEDLDAVSADMLTARRDEYLAQLDELDGAVQFSLRATYDEDVVLAEILAEDDEIRQLNEATRGAPEEAMRAERVRLGELVVTAFGAKRPADAEAVLDRARSVARAVVARASGAPAAVVDAALLVDRERADELEEQLERLARELAPRIRLRLVGPQAPYDFVAD